MTEVTDEQREQMMGTIQEMFDSMENTCVPCNGVQFDWSATGVGFGQFYFYEGDGGKLHCSNETMGKDFIKKMLCQMVDDCVLDDQK